jgi:hypothetical protein
MKNCVDSFSFSLQEFQVHALNPLWIIFFHTFGMNDEWKETWTTRPINNREKCICWPEKWLPEDLNNNLNMEL